MRGLSTSATTVASAHESRQTQLGRKSCGRRRGAPGEADDLAAELEALLAGPPGAVVALGLLVGLGLEGGSRGARLARTGGPAQELVGEGYPRRGLHVVGFQ
jgi:hypothetical protein